ncbi:MAG TPA: phosphopentomutase [Gemmatimonadales bacterium]|nr:phosphopentomutase [Gemmatimonadales bacterium]
MSRRAGIIVLDGLGVGEAHDAAAWGDRGSATLGNVVRATPDLDLPNLVALGIGHCGDAGLPAAAQPRCAHGTAEPASQGKDSTTGHWELCGLILERPFPTFPEGFPAELLSRFSELTGRGVLANIAGSGTRILDDFGARHVQTGDWIIYTSADSVFQVAAHEDVVPLGELYAACAVARELLTGEVGVSRVIARPFAGMPGAWQRTARRKDFSLEPPGRTLLDALAAAHQPVVGVGKVDDLFAGRGVRSIHTATNQEAYDLISDALETMRRGLLFVNVIEFDQTWGHRNDVAGFAGGLRELDRWIPRLLGAVGKEDLIILTADHGNDPTTPSTDHARERVPVLVLGGGVRPVSIGARQTFADVGQTVAEFLGVPQLDAGTSFLDEVWAG